MLEKLKKEVLAANLMLQKYKLVLLTWGNVSGIDRGKNLIVIKPSGIPYDELTEEKLVVLDMDGNIIEGNLNPSTDTPTHLYLYKTFREINGIVHTHSTWATIFSQAGMNVPPLGTTHADTFYGDIPCTRKLTYEEVKNDYEKNTGKVISETIKDKKKSDIFSVPGILVNGHGPFTWGKSPDDAVKNSLILEQVCKMAYYTKSLNPEIKSIDNFTLDKHYLRKHGSNAYYGQKIDN